MPSVNDLPLLQFFAFGHLPEAQQKISKKFTELAELINEELPRNSESSAAIRKLLESKDCAVRSSFMK